ncbi:hypothetical protein vBVpaMR16F_175 [Vibrio phage vB_VpaM_R16F]|nr:hypothetical protein vBVpaMR16F_175 [Vibrio phage vB_VpaM_R16F]
MSSFIIEETLENSIGRDSNGNPINEILFTVVSWKGRNFLYEGKFIEHDWQGNSRIAECVNGDYQQRYGGIKGWLRHTLKRTDKRINKISEQMKGLQNEYDELYDLKYKLCEGL